jgi:hypothetical protein
MGEEFFDDELVGMVNYSDDTVPQQMPVMEVKSKSNTNAEVNTEVETEKRVKRIAEDCNDCPFTKKRSLFDRLWDMTKWLGICGGICMLMWWFEMNGLMATEAARPFTFACGGVGFFGAGWSGRR